MDDDLWDPPNYADVQDATSSMQTGLDYEFYFDCRTDVIEEDAKNERSVMEVLRILIKKADTEIDELQRDLVLLKVELAWVENPDWFDICCNSLRKKMHRLDKSLKILREGKAEDSEIQLLMCRGPTETLHETLSALLKNPGRAKDYPVLVLAILNEEQIHDVVVLDSPCDSAQRETEDLDRNAKTCNSRDVEIIEIRYPSHATADRGAGWNLQKKVTDDSKQKQMQKQKQKQKQKQGEQRPRQSEAGQLSSGVDDTQTPTKKWSDAPMLKEFNCSIVPTQSSNAHMGSMSKKSEDVLKDERDPKAIARYLEGLELIKLRAIARKHGLTMYFGRERLIQTITKYLKQRR